MIDTNERYERSTGMRNWSWSEDRYQFEVPTHPPSFTNLDKMGILIPSHV